MDNLFETILGVFIVLGVILVSMTLHELMHGFVAYKLGDDTAKLSGRLTLNPLKHLDPVYSVILPLMMFVLGGTVFGGAKPVPVNSYKLKGKEWGMALVAIAGPLTNLVLAFLMFLLRFFLIKNLGGMNEIIDLILSYFVMVNLGFAVFNILPIPPLDGSRVLYAIAPDGFRNILNKMEAFGVWIVYGLIVIFGSAFSMIISGGVNGILQFFYWIVGL